MLRGIESDTARVSKRCLERHLSGHRGVGHFVLHCSCRAKLRLPGLLSTGGKIDVAAERPFIWIVLFGEGIPVVREIFLSEGDVDFTLVGPDQFFRADAACIRTAALVREVE